MKNLVLAAAVLASPLFASQNADACAMRRREPVVVAVNKPAVPSTTLADAKAAEARGERHTAIRLYEAVMNAPGSSEDRAAASLAAARLLAADGQGARAVARAQKAVGFAPRDAQAQLLLGELMVDGEAGRAMAHLKKAEAMGVSGAEAIRLALAQARAYAAFGDAESARAQLDKARDLGADTASIAQIEISLNGAKVASKI